MPDRITPETASDLPPRPAFSGRAFIRLALVALITAIAFVGWSLWVNRGSRAAVGVYITGDGQSCIEIRRTPLGLLRVNGGSLCLGVMLPPDATNSVFSVKYRGGQLLVQQHQSGVYGSGESKWEVLLDLTLEPSESVDGDWDIVDASSLCDSHRTFGNQTRRAWDAVVSSGDWGKARSLMSSALTAFSDPPWTLPAASRPIPSFLCRVDDERLPAYVDLRQASGDSARTLALAQSLSDDHPNNLLLALHAVEQEARAGLAGESAKRWESLSLAVRDSPSSLTPQVAWLAYSNMKMAVFRRDYPGLKHYYEFHENARPPFNQDEYDQWLLRGLKADTPMLYDRPLILEREASPDSPIKFDGMALNSGRNVAGAESMFDLMRGRRSEALSRLAGLYRLGQSLCLADRNVSISGQYFRLSTTRELAIVALNACETRDEIEMCWAALERLRASSTYADKRPSCRGPHGVWSLLVDPRMGTRADPWKAQRLHADAAFENLRVAMAVREFQIETGALPTAESQMFKRFPHGLPDDPFTTGTRRLQLATSGTECVVWSVGLDGADDGGLVEYTGKYGSSSDGDVLLRIPLQREFPFPRGPALADCAAELLAQFPNGLPRDPFTHTGRPFGVIEAKAGEPVVVFATGPHRETSDTLGVPWPNPPPDASTSRRLQPIYTRPGYPSVPDGQWTLAAPYDPTNGTISAGDFFLEIPPSGRGVEVLWDGVKFAPVSTEESEAK